MLNGEVEIKTNKGMSLSYIYYTITQYLTMTAIVTKPFQLMSLPDNLIYTFDAAIMMLHVFGLNKICEFSYFCVGV